jgi:hypothetical protein
LAGNLNSHIKFAVKSFLTIDVEKLAVIQGRSDGVSRISNAYGTTAQGAHQRKKVTLDISENFVKSRKITNFGRFAYGLTRHSLWLCSNLGRV